MFNIPPLNNLAKTLVYKKICINSLLTKHLTIVDSNCRFNLNRALHTYSSSRNPSSLVWLKSLDLLRKSIENQSMVVLVGNQNIAFFNIDQSTVSSRTRFYRTGFISQLRSQGRWLLSLTHDYRFNKRFLSDVGLIIIVSSDVKVQESWLKEAQNRLIPTVHFIAKGDLNSQLSLSNASHALVMRPSLIKNYLNKIVSLLSFYSKMQSESLFNETIRYFRWKVLLTNRLFDAIKKRRFFYVRRKLASR